MSAVIAQTGPGPRQSHLRAQVASVSQTTRDLLIGLTAEDCMLQSMPEASPIKWHVAHVAWFFETFLLANTHGFTPYDPAFRRLFNSYYVGVGDRHPRAQRGLLSRPSFERVQDYHRAVHEALLTWLDGAALDDALLDLVELGVHHQQQHQELMVTDLKHHFWHNPELPAWRDAGSPDIKSPLAPMEFVRITGGKTQIGTSDELFAFDNERPVHPVWLSPFELATRPVCNGDYLRFIEDGGYRRPELWLSDGWDVCVREGWQAPLYWMPKNGRTTCFTVHGERELAESEPVCHISYYEADAFARWANARLPTEQEWEAAARLTDSASAAGSGDFADAGRLHPQPLVALPGRIQGLLGGVWEWTQSAYLPYPGFRCADGAVGEYNGKFMINQMVLRGGSCATPASHIRMGYRNFFTPAARWQFSGLRLARS